MKSEKIISIKVYFATVMYIAIICCQREVITFIYRVFAANICDKISQMIHNVATPVELKLSLIPVLQYMHHDVSMATKVNSYCGLFYLVIIYM